MLIEARQQLALVLPMWCTLWLAAATWMGRRWALPWLALAASFVLQTHFTYAYQTVAVAGAATIAFAVHHRGDLASVVRPIDRHRRGHRAVLGPTGVGSAVSHRQRRRRARPVGRIGAVRRRVAGPAHPRRVGVRAPVLHPWLDGRPVARGTTAVAAGRRVRPCGVGGSTRRSGDRDAPPPPGPGRNGGDRRDGPRRVGRRRRQDPAHRAVRDHRPELLLELADRRVPGDGDRRQHPAPAVSAVGRTAPAAIVRGPRAGAGHGDGAGGRSPAPTDQRAARDGPRVGRQPSARQAPARRSRCAPRRTASARSRAHRPRRRAPRALHPARRTATTRHRLRVPGRIDRPLQVRRRAVRRRNGRVPTDPARRLGRRAAPWTRHAAGGGTRTHR